MDVPAGPHASGPHNRIVGAAGEFRGDRGTQVGNGVLRGAVDLGNAPPCVGIMEVLSRRSVGGGGGPERPTNTVSANPRTRMGTRRDHLLREGVAVTRSYLKTGGGENIGGG